MGFFNRTHKKLAKCNSKELQHLYSITELGLKNAAATGNEKTIREAMQKHQVVEYALLYKNTPEYKKLVRKNLRRNNGK